MNQEIKSDNFIYDWIELYADSFEFYYSAITHYLELLESDIDAMKQDEHLMKILDEEAVANSPAIKEAERIRRLLKWMDRIKEDAGDNLWDYSFSNISHGAIRLIKSVGVLYLNHLKAHRDLLTQKGNLSASVIGTVDSRIAKLQEATEMGVFKDAELKELLVGDYMEVRLEEGVPLKEEIRSFQTPIVPIIVKSDTILDSELQARCMDLFELFKSDGNNDRLDTVVTEATRILEDRLRRTAGLSEEMIGKELANEAFSKSPPLLKVSDVVAEQKSVHLLFLGVFGFIRNRVHHNIVSELKPERVIQILGTIDYLLSIIESAQKKHEAD